jgi:hypothetical protein
MIILIFSLLLGCTGNKYESPAYSVISSDEKFEIRGYPQIVLASTPMQKRSENGAFMKLFRFIQGRNDRREKIAMTTPVIMTGSSSGVMSFILPKSVAENGAPAPSNPDVSLAVRPPAHYAVYRFSGSDKPIPSEIAAKKLLAWVKSHNIQTLGSPFFAYYNPPWTPGFLRRNEVLILLAPTP